MRTKSNNLIGPRVRERRNALGLSLTDLAALAGCHRQSIHRVERGRVSPSLRLATRLASALGTSVGDLLAEKKIPPP